MRSPQVFRGLQSRPDESATQPGDWDAEEDGEWSPPVVEGQDATALLAAIIKRQGGNASGLSDAYAFSSSAQLVRHRGSTGGAATPEMACDDFTGLAKGGVPSIVALLHTGDVPTGAGGETVLPALGLTVPAEAGRLLLIESTLADGRCDPTSGYYSAPITDGKSDKLLLRKTFYTDRSHSREAGDKEGPQRGVPNVQCAGAHGGAFGCTRYEHVPAAKGDAVLPLRGEVKPRQCLAPNAYGPCLDSDFTPPPPKPKKKPPPPPPPPPSPPPKKAAPRAPGAPGAPPPADL